LTRPRKGLRWFKPNYFPWRDLRRNDDIFSARQRCAKRASVSLSVRLFVTRVDQSKTFS